LQELSSQVTAQKFTYSIVVVDNDRLQSAKPVADQFKVKSAIPLCYVVEAQQNIALARNKAIESASGNYLAFIDDDEFPTANWLLLLFETCQQYQVDGARGPVKPYFETPAPEWVVKGKFYDRPTYPTGYVIDWRKGRTGNVLLKKSLFRAGETAFRYAIENGIGVFYWIDDNCGYALSGNLDRTQLLAVARVVYTQLAARDAAAPK
jgi:succinoglycan biosynthesis protein ExoM